MVLAEANLICITFKKGHINGRLTMWMLVGPMNTVLKKNLSSHLRYTYLEELIFQNSQHENKHIY